ncbi:MAG: CHAD domain-containing protein [Burkholderiales bacterium]|nr:CHAD domain-containing protein [Burkholderiales bacterium]
METELKLLLAPQDLRRLRRDPRIKALQAGRASTRRVHSVYYDTPQQDLLRAGLALRLRRDGRRWLQTLKSRGQATAGLHLREEWEWPLPGEALDFGLLAVTPEGKRFRAPRLRAALAPIFTTEFTRTSLRLVFAEGSLAELCLDSGEIRSGRRASAISEAEIELLAGSTTQLYELALELVERLPLRLGQASKAERGYALARGLPQRPVKAPPLQLDAQASVATAFAAIVGSCMAHLQANEAGFLAGRDPEYLHQVRVALRRMRACFSLFRSVLPQSAFAQFLSQLQERNAALGRARDWDVFVHEMLRALRAQRADEAAVLAFQRRCLALGRTHLRTAQGALAAAAWQRMWLEFGRLLVVGAWMREHAALALPLDGFASSLLQQRAAVLRKRGKGLQELDAAGRHRLRIAAKKLRYAAEFFAALFPKRRLRPYVQSLAAMQEVLGALNDAATLLRLLPEALAGARVPDARVAGMIQGWSAASTHLHLEALQRAWEHWQRQKPFWKSS